ncbi:hypothetical protein [Bradyrhizobium sp.]|uniref:hypothetical protein n=1 Tax=Bradyrhizobium sp. TaxID=376 RepID=UPI001ECEC913|nr:hypothetical protein [Bradyrhizobium sp.]MBV9978452.1 hypothetical protein [Bradyrhizobium sp.]
MLNNLDAYPLPFGGIAAEDEIPPMTRLVVHEVGHVVAAADAGIPTDYVVIDPVNGYHAGYIDEVHRSRLESDTALGSRILAAGFAAEMALLSAAHLPISREDLLTLASRLGIPMKGEPDGWMKLTALRALWVYQPVLQPDAVDPIKCTYARLASAIMSKQYMLNGAHVIPVDAFNSLALPLPDAEYWRAHERTEDGAGRDDILATLRDGAQSGA